MSLGEGQVGMQQTAMLVLEIRFSVSFKSFIIYGNRLSLSFVLFFFPSQKPQFTEFITSAVTCSQEEEFLLSLSTTESALQTDHKTSHYLPCPISQSTAPAPSRSLPH